MNTDPSENNVKTVLELDLASYSDTARALEENLDVYAVKAFEDQVQSFVDYGLEQVRLKRSDVVLGTAGDNALLVFEGSAVMHRFAEAVQRAVAIHNREKTVESAKRWFRMGAATGAVLVLQAERRIVGTTVSRAVRLEAAAKNGQLLIDIATYASLPDELKNCYGEEEEISGKRDERFLARRCVLLSPHSVPDSVSRMPPVRAAAPERTAPASLPRPAPSGTPDPVLPHGYKLIDLIARTTNSVVMRVLEERTGQAAVLKRTAQPASSRLDIAALGVQCPGVLLPRKCWSEGEATYELLDWVEGYTLASIIEQARVPVRGALLDHWVTTLVELIVPLHGAKPPIIHRDITPSNVIVAMADLGLCLIDTSSACLLGQPQHPVGSPSYAPREQLAGSAVPSSDLYSIGALAYHLAMNRLPPTFISREQALKRRGFQGVQHEVPSETDLHVDTGGLTQLEEWILHMLRLNPVARPQNADDALGQRLHEVTLRGVLLGTLPLPNGKRVIMNQLYFSIESGQERSG